MNALTAALKEELNVDMVTVFGLSIPESVVVSWGIMAFLVIGSILLTRNLRVDHITKRQAILETVVTTINDFFVGLKGVYVPLAETVKGFAAIVDGQCDDLPEWAFFNVGTLADARKKYADKQAEEKGGAN